MPKFLIAFHIRCILGVENRFLGLTNSTLKSDIMYSAPCLGQVFHINLHNLKPSLHF